MENHVSIAIVGGGIGGLTAALSLLRAGFDVHVYEQSRALGEVGAGINITPNASRLLHRLGLAAELAKTAVKPVAFHQRRWEDGRTLLKSPLGEAVEAAFGSPHYLFHRGDLHATLGRAIPPDRIHLGHRCVGFIERDNRVEARFENGAQVASDVLIGADGIRSMVRQTLLGPENPRFTGCVAYRGLVPAERVAHLNLEPTIQIWMGPHRHFVHYLVSAGRFLNFVAHIEQDTWLGESWTDRGEVADLSAAFEGWHLQIHAIISAIDETFKWALFDRIPLTRWSVGRVTLLGDACHPMLPYMAQGAAQAVEDAAALTACLANVGAGDIAEALRRYEQVRLPRATRVQIMSRDNKTRFHLPDGPAQQERDRLMASGSTDWSFSAVSWLYGHDAGVLTG